MFSCYVGQNEFGPGLIVVLSRVAHVCVCVCMTSLSHLKPLYAVSFSVLLSVLGFPLCFPSFLLTTFPAALVAPLSLSGHFKASQKLDLV